MYMLCIMLALRALESAWSMYIISIMIIIIIFFFYQIQFKSENMQIILFVCNILLFSFMIHNSCTCSF